jgi:hypothetical protein
MAKLVSKLPLFGSAADEVHQGRRNERKKKLARVNLGRTLERSRHIHVCSHGRGDEANRPRHAASIP